MQDDKLRILMIEDDLAQAELITDMLTSERRQQYSVQQVNYLAQGLETLKGQSFDCALVDLGLPDSQGLETALSVRREAKELPIVVLTVLDDEESALRALELNIQDYLIKGEINRAVLTRSIRYAIQRMAVAKQVAESEQRLRFASRAAGIGMWHWDLLNDQFTLDDKSKELLGFDRDDSPGHDQISKAVHPDDRERINKAIHRSFEKNEMYSEEMRVSLPGGAVRWIVSKGRAHYDEQGKPLRADGINMDITESKQWEEKVRKSESKFSKIFHSAPSLIIVSTVKDGRIVDLNETAAETLGYWREELIGRNVYELGIWGDAETWQRVIAELVNRRPVRNVEMQYLCREGRPITGLLAAELIEVEGEPCALMLVRDITERKRAEEALLIAKEEWERTFNAVPDLIAILDTEYRIVRINDAMAKMVGLSPEECIGLHCYSVFHGSDTPPLSCPHVKAMSESRQQISETQEIGRNRFFLVSYTPLIDPDGNPVGVVHVARDITEQKLAEQRIEQLMAELASRAADLEAANKELEAFNYTAAHDLRQPLNVIDGYCQAVEIICGSQLDAECHGFLGEISQGVRRMSNLLDALLNFSRMSRVEPQRAVADLSSIARGVANELQNSDPQRSARFAIADGIEVNGDPALLEIVMRNLLGNAWKYSSTREDALIEVGGYDEGGRTICYVRDNGIGFDMADADKVFAPFQRLGGTRSIGGFGIGLATVQRIVARHGGKVWAEGEPGKGATFYFTLSGEDNDGTD